MRRVFVCLVRGDPQDKQVRPPAAYLLVRAAYLTDHQSASEPAAPGGRRPGPHPVDGGGGRLQPDRGGGVRGSEGRGAGWLRKEGVGRRGAARARGASAESVCLVRGDPQASKTNKQLRPPAAYLLVRAAYLTDHQSASEPAAPGGTGSFARQRPPNGIRDPSRPGAHASEERRGRTASRTTRCAAAAGRATHTALSPSSPATRVEPVRRVFGPWGSTRQVRHPVASLCGVLVRRRGASYLRNR